MLSALVFGCIAAGAAGIAAQPKTAAVLIDGQIVDLKGYIIDGSHYFQLRDVDEKLKPGGKDFSVVWDGANNSILIDTSRGYDPNEALPAVPPPPSEYQLPTWESIVDKSVAEAARLINIEREKAGVSPLTGSADLAGLAMMKSQDMAEYNLVDHNSPTFGYTKGLLDMKVWSRYIGETITRGAATPDAAVKLWMASDAHRKILLNSEATHIGIGMAKNIGYTIYWTALLATAG